MKKEILSLVVASTLLVGCGESEKQTLVKRYFDAMKEADIKGARATLKKT